MFSEAPWANEDRQSYDGRPLRSFHKASEQSSTMLSAAASSLGSCTSGESIFNATSWDGYATENHIAIGHLNESGFEM
jgi:hypothetical protein